MHTISDLRKALGLSTTNQVRNRIEAIKDVLTPHLRRGPNNQILISDAGVALLRRLQDLYDSGLTLAEASEVLLSSTLDKESRATMVSSSLAQKQVRAEQRNELVATLKDEITFLRQRVAFLEAQQRKQLASPPRAWWESLMEEGDGA